MTGQVGASRVWSSRFGRKKSALARRVDPRRRRHADPRSRDTSAPLNARPHRHGGAPLYSKRSLATWLGADIDVAHGSAAPRAAHHVDAPSAGHGATSTHGSLA